MAAGASPDEEGAARCPWSSRRVCAAAVGVGCPLARRWRGGGSVAVGGLRRIWGELLTKNQAVGLCRHCVDTISGI